MSSTFDRLRKKAKDNSLPEQPEVQGMWFNIRVMPDLATGELLNIGVGFSSSDRPFEYRLLDRFEAFGCLYHKRVSADGLRFLIQTVQSSLPNRLSPGALPLIPSPNIQYSEPKFITGHSSAEILEDLYKETVTLAHVAHNDTGDLDKSTSLSTSDVRKQVFAAIVELDPLSSIVAEDPQWLLPIKEDGKQRILDMPLRSVHRFGTVLSAFYHSDQSFKLNMLKAGMDMETAFRLYEKDYGGLFILRPSPTLPGYTEKDHAKIDNVIEELDWHMKRDTFQLVVSDSDNSLAEHILGWAA